MQKLKSLQKKLSSGFAQLVLSINTKLRVDQFSAKHFAGSPRIAAAFRVGVPSMVMLAVVAGIGIASWQIASFAKEGDVRVSSPANGTTVNGDFEAKIVFKASQNRPTYNLVMKLDDRVIDARVGSAINEGDTRTYTFSSGTGGANAFNHNLLSPGAHRLRIEAKTGSVVGSGEKIDISESHFTVKGVKNIATTGETKTIGAAELPLNASPRNASLPAEKKDLLAKLNDSLFPKVSAHSGTGARHGSFVVTGPPGAIVLVGHAGHVLDGCHSGNGAGLSAAGVVGFFDCAVSNNGGTSAVYDVCVGSVPPEWTMQDVHCKQINVEWGQTKSIGFNYIATPAPTPPPPPPPPPPAPEVTGRGDLIVVGPPGWIALVGHDAGVLPGCSGGNSAGIGEAGAVRFTGCAVSTQGGDSAVYRVAIGRGTGPDRWKLKDVHEKKVTIEKGQVKSIRFIYEEVSGGVGGSPGGGGGGSPGGGGGTTPAPLSYSPDDGPLISLDSLTSNEATVSAFGYKLVNNQPANYVKEVYALVDGNNKVSSVTAFTPHATHVNVKLPLPNLNDGNDHTVALVAMNENGKTNAINLKILANKPNNVTAPSQPHGTGSIKVSVYAHDKPGQPLNKDKDARVGSLYIDARNIGDGVGQCEKQNGLTDNDRSNASNFGRIEFNGCPVALDSADNYAKKYEISMIMPEGFNEDPTFNANTGTIRDGNYLKREIKVQKNLQTEVSLVIVGSNSNTLTTGEAKRAEGEKKTNPTENHGTGSIKVTVYSHEQVGQSLNENKDARQGNITVKTENIGSAGDCNKKEGKTDNDRDHADNFGRIEFKDCPIALLAGGDNHAKKYRVTITIPGGFSADPTFNSRTGATTTGNSISREVTVRKNQQTAVSFLVVGSSKNSISSAEFIKPNPPTNLRAQATEPGKIVLNWDKPNNADSYVIERSEGDDVWDILTEEDEVKGNSFTDDDVGIRDKKFTYRVYAINRAGYYSDPATTQANTTQVWLSGLGITEVGPGVVQLAWTMSPSNANNLSTGVERSTDGQNWELLDFKPMGMSYTDETAAFGTKYYYKISVYLNDSSYASNEIINEVTTGNFEPNVIGGDSSAYIEENSKGKVYAAEKASESTTNVKIDKDTNGFLIEETGGTSKAKAIVPTGALNFDAQCAITPTYGNYELPKNKKINGKAYTFVCKDVDGNQVFDFGKEVSLVFPLENKYGTNEIYDLGIASKIESEYKAGSRLLGSPGTILATTASTGIFAALVDSSSNSLSTTPLMLVISVACLTILAVGFTGLFVRKKILTNGYKSPPDPDI